MACSAQPMYSTQRINGIVNLGRQLGQIWALRWAENCCRDLT
jgi:hypothetical protein